MCFRFNVVSAKYCKKIPLERFRTTLHEGHFERREKSSVQQAVAGMSFPNRDSMVIMERLYRTTLVGSQKDIISNHCRSILESLSVSILFLVIVFFVSSQETKTCLFRTSTK